MIEMSNGCTGYFQKDGYVFKKYPRETDNTYGLFVLFAMDGFAHSIKNVEDRTNLSTSYIKSTSSIYKWADRLDKYEKYYIDKWVLENIQSHEKWSYDVGKEHGMAWHQQENERNWEYFCFLFYLYIKITGFMSDSLKDMLNYLAHHPEYSEIISRGRGKNSRKPVLLHTLYQIKTNHKWDDRVIKYFKNYYEGNLKNEIRDSGLYNKAV